jgi:sugar lactone lactonase YvrE
MRRIFRCVALGIVFVLGILILYLLLWPVKIDPAAWTPPAAPAASGIPSTNSFLSRVEKIARGYVGPESIAVDSHRDLYAGLFDGRIIRISPDGESIEVFAQAGEPLGLEFAADGSLVVADAILGLISIDRSGRITTLTTQAEGSPINFADDLAIASDGKIYFSDASKKYSNMESFADLFEHRPNGRLLVYDPVTSETRLLLDELYFPNGVALSPDESCLLFSETSMYRICRYWLAGDRAGQVEVFIDNLPGFPDNITCDGEDTYWVALAGGPKSRAMIDPVLPKPFLRKVLWRLPFLFASSSTGEGHVLGLDLNGNILHNLQDPDGESLSDTTSAIEHLGMLYIGSWSADGLGCMPVP